MSNGTIFFIFITMLFSNIGFSQKCEFDPRENSGVTLRQIVRNLSRPVQMVFKPNSTEHFIVQQRGLIITRKDLKSPFKPWLDYRSKVSQSANETGLLGFALHPQFPKTPKFYLNYTIQTSRFPETHRTKIVEMRIMQNGMPDLNSEKSIMEFDQPYTNHNGGDMKFGPDGLLYISVGDGGSGKDPENHSQNLASPLGKMLRVNVDKPFTTSVFATNAKGNPSFPKTSSFSSSLAIPQIYAYGLRNPWRFSFDSLTKQLWTADVGQNLQEEVNILQYKGNYGWRIMEGKSCHMPSVNCNQQGLILPVFQYKHSEGRSATGGFVYRGSKIPGLYGHYIFGDYVSGKIWALNYVGGQVKSHKEIYSAANLQVVSFAQDSKGELYVIGFNGNIYSIEPAKTITNIKPMPTKLSSTGCFANMDPEKPVSNAIKINVNAPLWSDGAIKDRYVLLQGNQKASIGQDGTWNYPLGTTLIKNFFFNVFQKDGTSKKQIVETRFFIKKTSGFKGYSYQWNDDQTEAILLTTRATKNLKVELAGKTINLTYQYPSSADCITCHSTQTEGPLALTTLQTFNVNSTGKQQWTDFFNRGLLDKVPNGNFNSLDGYNKSQKAHASNYLHVHCGSCHNGSGGAGRGNFNFSLPNQTPEKELCDLKVNVNGQDRSLIDPSDPQNSWLYVRAESSDPLLRMPPISTSLNSSFHLNALADWIGSVQCP